MARTVEMVAPWVAFFQRSPEINSEPKVGEERVVLRVSFVVRGYRKDARSEGRESLDSVVLRNKN